MKGKELIVILLFVCSNTLAQTSMLDLDFGENGILETVFDGIDQPLNHIEETIDEKILLGLSSLNQTDSSNITFLRLLEDGQLDETFGKDGFSSTKFRQKRPSIHLVHTFLDGKFQVIGSLKESNVNKESSIFFIRYTDKGFIDVNYGNQGKIIIPSSNEYEIIHSVDMRPDSTILIIARNKFPPEAIENAGLNKEWYIKKYDLHGHLDETYGDKGVKIIEKVETASTIRSIHLLPDGQIYTAGVINSPNKGYFIKRYTSEIRVDSTFGINGVSTVHFNGKQHLFSKIKIQPNGKILILGSIINIAKYDFALARFNTNGSIDNTFGDDGKITTEITNETSVVFQSDDFATDLMIQSDGKILVSGYTSAITGLKRHQVIIRYNPNGVLDDKFGKNGKLITELANRYSEADMLLPFGEAKILVVGESWEENYQNRTLMLARYKVDQRTSTFNNPLNVQNILISPNPIKNTAILKYTLEKPETLTIQLFNLNGQLLKTYLQDKPQKVGIYQQQIDLPTGLPAGMYFVRLSSSNGQTMIKVVK